MPYTTCWMKNVERATEGNAKKSGRVSVTWEGREFQLKHVAIEAHSYLTRLCKLFEDM